MNPPSHVARSLIAKCSPVFCEDPRTVDSLGKELGSDAAARAALRDLWLSSATLEAGTGVVRRALGLGEGDSTVVLPRDWALLLPSNHSLVAPYPLAVAYLSGMKMFVKAPTDELASLNHYLTNHAALPDSGMRLLPPSLRAVDLADSQDWQGMMCFGRDSTLSTLSREFPGPLVGFSEAVGVSVVDRSQIHQRVSDLVRDAFSLGQQGCMAVRMVLVVDDRATTAQTKDEIASRFFAETKAFWRAPFRPKVRAGIDYESCRLSRRGGVVASRSSIDEPSLVWFNSRQLIDGEINLPELVARHPFVLPFIFVESPHWDQVVDALAQSTPVKTVTCAADFSRLQDLSSISACLRNLGRGNRPLWDGTHDGQPLFRPVSRSFGGIL